MRIAALIIVVMLVSPGFVAAVESSGQTDLMAMSESQDIRAYTGIIKNKTRYEVSIPSENSDATLLVPPNGWIEYTIWTKNSNVTAYHNGQPFYCLNIISHPQEYPFMCKKYDFMAEIVKEEPGIRPYPSKLKRRKIKQRVNPPC